MGLDSSDTGSSVDSSADIKTWLDYLGKNFIDKLEVDHPQFARLLIEERLPNFLKNIKVLWEEFKEEIQADPDKLSPDQVVQILEQENPDEEFIKAIIKSLTQLEYISFQEILSIMQGYASEVEDQLRTDPTLKIIFVTDYFQDESETYFANIVKKMIPEKYQSRILFSDDIDMISPRSSRLIGQPKIIVYRFDDSSNSGSQLISNVRNYIERYRSYSVPVDFRFRLVASSSQNMGDYIRERVESRELEENDAKVPYSIDLVQKYLNKRIEVIYKGQIVTWGTSIVFAHKIQDNMPTMFISLGSDHRRDKPHLFEYDEDIIPPYKKQKERK